MKRNDWKDRLNIVYSTDPDYQYEFEEKVLEIKPEDRQMLKISLDKKNRGGKVVTLITGFQTSVEKLENLCRLLKKKCGVGGSVKDMTIVIQGDFREKIVDILRKEGYLKARII